MGGQILKMAYLRMAYFKNREFENSAFWRMDEIFGLNDPSLTCAVACRAHSVIDIFSLLGFHGSFTVAPPRACFCKWQ